MKLPAQVMPAVRERAWLASAAFETGYWLYPSRKQCMTGTAVCKRRGNVLFSDDEAISAEVTQEYCTAAKNAAAASILPACDTEGGTVMNSGSPCSVGENCRTAADC